MAKTELVAHKNTLKTCDTDFVTIITDMKFVIYFVHIYGVKTKTQHTDVKTETLYTH